MVNTSMFIILITLLISTYNLLEIKVPLLFLLNTIVWLTSFGLILIINQLEFIGFFLLIIYMGGVIILILFIMLFIRQNQQFTTYNFKIWLDYRFFIIILLMIIVINSDLLFSIINYKVYFDNNNIIENFFYMFLFKVISLIVHYKLMIAEILYNNFYLTKILSPLAITLLVIYPFIIKLPLLIYNYAFIIYYFIGVINNVITSIIYNILIASKILLTKFNYNQIFQYVFNFKQTFFITNFKLINNDTVYLQNLAYTIFTSFWHLIIFIGLTLLLGIIGAVLYLKIK